MIKSSAFFLILGFLLFAACARETYNISWSGVVADKTTGKPVKHARIVAASSYQVNIDETADLTRYLLSDEYGRFRVSFQRGFGLTVRTSASGYLTGIDYKVVKSSNISDTIFLSSYPFDASLVVRKMDTESFSSSAPFIRESRFWDELNDSEKSVKWGFDFLSGNNTKNLDSADVWVEVNQKNGRMVLNSSQTGGLFPVSQMEVSDFMIDVTRAPEKGYVRNHVITGNEVGFFVLCRNGINIAKMIPEDKICILSYEQADGSKVKETGIRFDYLFQPDYQNRLCFPVSASVMGAGFPDISHGTDFNELDSN